MQLLPDHVQHREDGAAGKSASCPPSHSTLRPLLEAAIVQTQAASGRRPVVHCTWVRHRAARRGAEMGLERQVEPIQHRGAGLVNLPPPVTMFAKVAGPVLLS